MNSKKVYTVTVLMNSYKENEQVFKAAVNSVYSNYKNVDIRLVVSTVKGDPCIEWCEEWPITVVVNEKADIFEQYNAMLPYVSGDYVTYASSNDIMYSDKLKAECTCLDVLNKGVCYSDFHIIDVNGNKSRFNSPSYSYEEHLNGSFVSDCAMIRTELFKKYMPLETRWGNNAVWDLYLRIYEGEGDVFTNLRKPTWEYRKTAESNSEKRKLNPKAVLENDMMKKKLKEHHIRLGAKKEEKPKQPKITYNQKGLQRIQMRCSDSIKFFKNSMMKKYLFSEYTKRNVPTIFFGLYVEEDYQVLSRHRGAAKILWGGSDAIKLQNFIKQYKPLLHRFTNIAQSSFIQNTLAGYGIPSELVPVTTVDLEEINPEPLGDSIYFYTGSGTSFYGAQYLKKLERQLEIPIIVTRSKQYPREKVLEMYKKCFMGLRLTAHDGLPHTVVEMGLMGRPCLFNGLGVPGTFNWVSIDDICTSIKTLHSVKDILSPERISCDMRNYLKGGAEWYVM